MPEVVAAVKCRAMVLGAAIGCHGEPAPPAIPVTIALEAPWALVSQDDDEIALRFGETGEGVRVWPRSRGDRRPGVTPVHDGRTLEVRDEPVPWPLVAFAYPDRVARIEVLVQGIDLVVRAYGPTIHEVTRRDDAPDDPVITWVRLRPRPADWRVVVDGLATVSLPPPGEALSVSEGGYTWTLRGPAGEFALDTNAPVWASGVDAERWWFDTEPSLWAVQPYPRTGITWTPVSP